MEEPAILAQQVLKETPEILVLPVAPVILDKPE
jgi:hypothetical protein